MIDITPYIQLLEVIWTAIALIGGYYAVVNLLEATKDRKAVMESDLNGIREEWANFSVNLHRTLIGVEFTFAFVGIVSMFRRPSPDATTITSFVLAAFLVGGAIAIAYLSYRWRQVDELIKEEVEKKTAQQDLREEQQDLREQEQEAKERELE